MVPPLLQRLFQLFGGGGICTEWAAPTSRPEVGAIRTTEGSLSLAMDEAAKELARQLARRQTIAELLVPARAAVEADKEANKGVRSCRA